MKKQILIFSALLIVAFFTACEQTAVIEPVEDIVQLEAPTSPPQEALDQLQTLIDSDFTTLESRDDCDSYGLSYGSVTTNSDFVHASILCGVKLDFVGATRFWINPGSTVSKTWIYYHVDEKKSNGNYILVDSDMSYGHVARWTKTYTELFHQSTCDYRAYVYLWDANCGKWKRLAEEYFD